MAKEKSPTKEAKKEPEKSLKEKRAAKKADVIPIIIPVRYLESKWKIKKIPNKLIKPRNSSVQLKFLELINGSSNAVNIPVDAKHTKPIDTFEYLMLP